MKDIWDLIPVGSMWRVLSGGALAWPSEDQRGIKSFLSEGTIVLVRRFDRSSDKWVEVVANGGVVSLHPSQFTTYNVTEDLCRIDNYVQSSSWKV